MVDGADGDDGRWVTTVTMGDWLYYVRQMSPVVHPKSIVPQIFFAF